MLDLSGTSADSPPPPAAPVPLASWYTQGLSDGFGDRLLMSDNTSDSSLELLRFRPELAAVPGFERILRGTVARLARFEHPAFAHVRAVERLESDGALALVSTHVPGTRLSEMFQGADRAAGVHPAFAAWLIRWLTPAIADLRARTGMAHGTITAERIVLASDGRPVLLEPAVGRAVEALGLSPDQLWQHFTMVVPPPEYGAPRLDDRSDIYQLGAVTLSLLLGRRLTPADLAGDLDPLLDELYTSPQGRASSFTPALCLWLDRALRTDGGGFRSAHEAWDGSRELSHAPRPDVLRLDARADVDAPGGRAPGETPLGRDIGRAQSQAGGARRFFSARSLAAGLALVVILQAIAIGMLIGKRPPSAGSALVPVRIESPEAGDIVIVDGREVGVTPLELTVGDSMPTIRVVRAAPLLAAAPTPSAPDPRPARPAANPPPAAASTPPPSGFRVESPIVLQVFDGARALGSSAGGPMVMPPGTYHLDLVNESLDYRSRLEVEVRRGEIRTLSIQPPGGRLSINALPWAQVWIDGKPVGETPIAYLPVAAGEHEIVFRHPALGERRETLIVRSGADARVSASFDD